MVRHFDEELQELKAQLLRMGALAETMIVKSVQALVDRNEALVQKVYEHEEEMDKLCIEVDDRAFTLLARRQPVASDLRFIAAAMKINSELERIADLAVDTAHVASSLLQQPALKPLVDIPRMASLAQEMVRRSLDAFVRRDSWLAHEVIESDDRVDDLRDQVFRELLAYMISDPTTVPHGMDFILVSRHIERIADHATNIAEDVIYLAKGEDVRERGDKELKKGFRQREERLKPPSETLGGISAFGAIPEEQEFLSLFQAVASNILEAAKALNEMFDRYEDPEGQWRGIEDLEHEGDKLTHQIMRKLNQTFITPIDRRDLYALTSALDNILDTIEAAASRMVLYKIDRPTPKAKDLVGLIVASAEQIVKAVASLSQLQGVEQPCVEINRLENAADGVYREAIAALFEEKHPPSR